MSMITKILGGVAIAVMAISSAHAAPSGVSFTSKFNASNNGAVTITGTDLSNLTSLTNSTGNFAMNFGSGPTYMSGSAVTATPGSLAIPAGTNTSGSLSGFGMTFGNFTFSETSGFYAKSSGDSGSTFLNLSFVGNITDSTGFYATQLAQVSETVNDTNGVIGASISLTTPVPEPTSMLLVGSAMLGLAAVRQRRA